MTNRFSERTRLSGVRMMCSQLGGLLAVSVPGVIMHFTGKDNPMTYTYTGMFFAVVFCVAVLLLGCVHGKLKMYAIVMSLNTNRHMVRETFGII